MLALRACVSRSASLRTFITKCVGVHRQIAIPRVDGFSTNASTDAFVSNANVGKDSTTIEWTDGATSRFHHIWLRDHCRCSECYNSETHQKELHLLDISHASPKNVTVHQDELIVTWQNDHETRFGTSWLRQHSYDEDAGKHRRGAVSSVDRCLWDKELIESKYKLPYLKFGDVIKGKSDWLELCETIIKFGFAFVSETPTQLQASEQISEVLAGFVRPTHYGGVTEFSNEAMDHADTAYTADYLRGHTDNTYFTDPAGLQFLHCTGHEGTGGMSLLVDGFYVAEKLRQTNYEAFKFLSSTTLPFHYRDDQLYLKAQGTVIEMHPFTNDVDRIRYNTYDLAPLTSLRYEDVPRCYDALQAFTALTCAPENQYWFKLMPGTLLIAANWRVLHGRSSFTGKRSMQSCYLNRDDFLGRFRAARQ